MPSKLSSNTCIYEQVAYSYFPIRFLKPDYKGNGDSSDAEYNMEESPVFWSKNGNFFLM